MTGALYVQVPCFSLGLEVWGAGFGLKASIGLSSGFGGLPVVSIVVPFWG